MVPNTFAQFGFGKKNPAIVEVQSLTLQGTNISYQKWHFEDDFPFPQVGYVNPLEGSFLEVGVSIPFRLQGGQPSFQERVVMSAVRTDNLVMGK